MSDGKLALIQDGELEKFVKSFPPPRLCGKCKDCKWWGEKKPLKVQRYCSNDNVAAQSNSDNPAAATSDDTLLTGPDFGCVHWEAKQ